MNAVIELEEAYNHYKNDPEFNRELEELFNEYAGRPSRLYYAEKMTEGPGRGEDLPEEGRPEPYRSTQDQQRAGPGAPCEEDGQDPSDRGDRRRQHGVATATAAALMDMECVVFMGEEDTVRQALNVYRMRLLGAEVIPVKTGTATLKDAVSERCGSGRPGSATPTTASDLSWVPIRSPRS